MKKITDIIVKTDGRNRINFKKSNKKLLKKHLGAKIFRNLVKGLNNKSIEKVIF